MSQNIYYMDEGLPFTTLNFTHKIKEINGNKNSIFILTNHGDVYFKGILGNYKSEIDFTKINISTKIKKINCAENFVIFLDNFNQLFICGEIYNKIYNEFTKICVVKDKIKFINCGGLNIIVLITKNNEILILKNITNYFEFTKMNIPESIENIKDLQIDQYYSILLDNLGSIYGINGELNNLQNKIFTKFNINFTVKQIAMYEGGTLLLNYNNELFNCNKNYWEQLSFYNNQMSKKIIFFSDDAYFKDIEKIENKNLIIKKLFHSDYSNFMVLTNNGFYSADCNGICMKMNYGEKNYKKYKNLIMCNGQIYIIESDDKINDKSGKKKNKIFNKLYLQLCNSDNLFKDITFNYF
ncbi:hypothetical protein ABK040_008552 [Willaertia magna]